MGFGSTVLLLASARLQVGGTDGVWKWRLLRFEKLVHEMLALPGSMASDEADIQQQIQTTSCRILTWMGAHIETIQAVGSIIDAVDKLEAALQERRETG